MYVAYIQKYTLFAVHCCKYRTQLMEKQNKIISRHCGTTKKDTNDTQNVRTQDSKYTSNQTTNLTA